MRMSPSRAGSLGLLVFLAAAPLRGAGTTALTLTSVPGDYIGGGTNRAFTAADGTFAARTLSSDAAIQVTFQGSGSEWWMLDFASPSGTLVPGTYSPAARFPFQATGTAGLDVGGDGRGCNALRGRFVVLEAALGADGSVQRFAADFEQHCEGGDSALYGSIRFQSSFPLEPRLFVEPASSNEGDAAGKSLSFRVSLSTVWSQDLSVAYRSADGTARATVDYTAVSGNITFSPGQFTATVPVSLIGNTAVQPDRSMLLSLSNASGGSIAFGEATGTIVDDDGTSFAYDSDLGDWVGGGRQRLFTRQEGSVWVTGSTSSAGAHASGGGEWWDALFSAPSGSALVPGIYEGAVRSTSATGVPGMDVSGNGAGCNQLSGRFLVMESEFDANHVLKKLAIDFEQHCERADPATFGSVRYYSTLPPFSRLASRIGFFPLAPCRLLDTRETATPLRPGFPQTFPAAGKCGIPFSARSLSVNVTVADATASGEVWLYAPALAQPTDGVLHFRPDRIRANWSFLPLGIGEFTASCEIPSSPTGRADVIIDVFGYWQ